MEVQLVIVEVQEQWPSIVRQLYKALRDMYLWVLAHLRCACC